VTIQGRQFLDELRVLAAGIRNNAHQALKSAVQAAEEDARGTNLYNDATGTLRKNTRGEVDGLMGELKAATKYAAWVESGTPPHEIQGRRGGTLRFVVGGSTVFARRVMHPGTAERPFMQHARDVGEKTLEYGLEYFTSAAIERG
jgi:hypothetical protein